MSGSVLDQLGQQQVPQPPAEFRRRLRHRLNAWLVTVHLADVVVRLLPYAFSEFLPTLFGAVMFSITGRYPERGNQHAKRNDQDR